jgi:hypothetical protein
MSQLDPEELLSVVKDIYNSRLIGGEQANNHNWSLADHSGNYHSCSYNPRSIRLAPHFLQWLVFVFHLLLFLKYAKAYGVLITNRIRNHLPVAMDRAERPLLLRKFEFHACACGAQRSFLIVAFPCRADPGSYSSRSLVRRIS